jgi:hypothetical protein
MVHHNETQAAPMKHFIAIALLAASLPTLAADVGVSISISEPGVYGRIDIGRFPQPAVVVAQPVIIYRPVAVPPPVYLWVPPGHRKDWGKHCGSYNACGVPVYFVQDQWYQSHVATGPGNSAGKGNGNGHGNGKGNGNGNGKGKD